MQTKTLGELQAEHGPPPVSRRNPVAAEHDEQSPWRNYVRDLILGLNDGIVSVYALVAGLAGAGLASHTVAIAGVAATVAGAISMGLGEYLSTKSQAQYYAAEAKREAEHIRAYPELEREELRQMLTEKKYPDELITPLLEHIAASEERFVEFMMREEFGVGRESGRSPVAAMLLVMGAFIAGAVLAVIPFFALAGHEPLLYATLAALGGLFLGGAAKGAASAIDPWVSGLEMVAFGSVAAIVTYGVGWLFHIQA